MTELYTISKFAAMTDTPVETIKYYDKIGLIKPAKIDPQNHYRYYSLLQCYTISHIKSFRSLGMSLDEIKQYFENKDINSSTKLLHDRINILDDQIERLNIQKEMLKIKLKHMNMALIAMARPDDIIINQYPERYYFSFGNVAKTQEEVNLSCWKLEHALSKYYQATYRYQLGFLIPQNELASDISTTTSIVFAFTDSSADISMPLSAIPAGKFVCGYHTGTYLKRSALILRLMDYIQKNNYKISGDILQIKLFDEDDAMNKDEFFYQIQIPITEN